MSEDGDETAGANSLKGLWIDEVFSEPEFKNAAFEKAWRAYYEKHSDEEEDNEYEIQEEFLKTYPEANWVRDYPKSCEALKMSHDALV